MGRVCLAVSESTSLCCVLGELGWYRPEPRILDDRPLLPRKVTIRTHRPPTLLSFPGPGAALFHSSGGPREPAWRAASDAGRHPPPRRSRRPLWSPLGPEAPPGGRDSARPPSRPSHTPLELPARGWMRTASTVKEMTPKDHAARLCASPSDSAQSSARLSSKNL